MLYPATSMWKQYKNEYVHQEMITKLFCLGAFTAGVSIVFLITGLAGVGIVNIFTNYHLRRDDFQSPDNFLANLSHGITT